MICWQTVWSIASNRNNTKMGEGHLTQNAFTVLQGFMQDEIKEAMEKTIGATSIILM